MPLKFARHGGRPVGAGHAAGIPRRSEYHPMSGRPQGILSPAAPGLRSASHQLSPRRAIAVISSPRGLLRHDAFGLSTLRHACLKASPHVRPPTRRKQACEELRIKRPNLALFSQQPDEFLLARILPPKESERTNGLGSIRDQGGIAFATDRKERTCRAF